jgi:hypothetical protein
LAIIALFIGEGDRELQESKSDISYAYKSIPSISGQKALISTANGFIPTSKMDIVIPAEGGFSFGSDRFHWIRAIAGMTCTTSFRPGFETTHSNPNATENVAATTSTSTSGP